LFEQTCSSNKKAVCGALKPAKVNFNQILLAQPISIHVCCPGDENNLADMAVRHAAVVDLFKRQCPKGACVEEVVPIRGRGKRKCAWRVRYGRDINQRFFQMGGEQLARNIIKFHPNNTEIVEKTRVMYPSFIELVHSILCDCNVSQTASRSIKKCDSVNVNVEENLVNLKLEEDLQE
jgi:hypothetical protein